MHTVYIDSLNRRNVYDSICDLRVYEVVYCQMLSPTCSLRILWRCLDRAEPLCLCAGEGSEGSEARGKYERLAMEYEGFGSYSYCNLN